jgi:diaminopimelate decarboxylase
MKYKDWLARKDLEYKEDILFFGDMNLNEIAEKYETPFYILNERGIRKRYREIKELIDSEYERNSIHYAVKANSNTTVLKILHSEGAHFDCTSKGEMYLCLKAGIPSDKILFTGNMLSDDDLEFAVENDIKINLDSISQLDRLIEIHNKHDKDKDIISFRINPEFGAGHHVKTITAGKDIKFGILEHQVIEAYERAIDAGFKKFGIHQHIGSGIIDSGDFEKATKKFLNIVQKVKERLSIKFEFIDFGGGLGIPYKPNQEPLDLEKYKNIVLGKFKELLKKKEFMNPYFFIEPGRFLVAEAEILICKVTTIKDNGYKLFAGVDAGFHTLIRPAMYGSYHHIIPCKDSGEGNKNYDIVGPLCESGDVLGKERNLPRLKEGDNLAILDTGAYGYSMSSSYNARPRPLELIISKDQIYEIRKAETLKDLLRLQKIPNHLE